MLVENVENTNSNQIFQELPRGKLSESIDASTLICAKFQQRLLLDFGTVKLKETKVLPFKLKNPSLSKSVQISVDSAGSSDFILKLGDGDDKVVTIPPLQICSASICWAPISNIMLREIIKLRMDEKGSLEVIVQGVGGKGIVEDASKKRQSVDSGTLNALKKKEMAGRRQSIAVVPKEAPAPVKEAVPASQEEVWAEKQAASFVKWINYNFQAAAVSDSLLPVDDSDVSPIFELAKKQKAAKLRQSASALFQSEGFHNALQLVESEALQQKIVLREDRDVLHDLGLQEAFFGILFSYDATWLTLGLEMVCGKPVKCRAVDNLQKLKNAVKAYALEHMFNSATIRANFGPQCTLYASKEKQLKGLLRKNLLIKFLSLVLFLDKGRLSGLLPKKALFAKESLYKSSKDILVSFCRCFLHGEGDIIKHLGLLGFQVAFAQSHVDEISYEVTNLAGDLRDGVRLALLLDVLTKSSSASSQLRIPAVSRLQKLHNVSVVLKQIFPEGSAIVDSKSIVDGNRDKTLFLLWNIMYTFELRTVLSPERIQSEVAAVRLGQGVTEEEEQQPAASAEDSIVPHLIAWIQAVTSPHNIAVNNLTSSLSDGRALCLLIRHYHSSLIAEGVVTAFSPEEAKQAERLQNLSAAVKACKSIGGIPPLLQEADRGALDDKTMIIFLGHLFVRLTDSAKQVKASNCLQRFFRGKSGAQVSKKLKACSRKLKRLDGSFHFASTSSAWKDEPLSIAPIAEPAVVPVAESAPATPLADLTAAIEEVRSSIDSKLAEEKALLERVVEQMDTLKQLEASEEDEEAAPDLVASEALAIVATIAGDETAAKIASPEVIIREVIVKEVVVDTEAARALLLSEASLRSESEARQALEVRVRAEMDARLALEDRLRQIELRNLQLVENMHRREIEVKLREFTRRRSARVIVGTWKLYSQKLQQSRIVKGVTLAQAMVRRIFAQRKYQCLVLAVQIMQSSWRRKRCARLLVAMTKSAHVIQAQWRRCQQSRSSQLRARCATKLSSWFRSAVATRQWQTLRRGSVRLQAVWRTRCATKSFAAIRHKVILLQSVTRRHSSARMAESRRKSLQKISKMLSVAVFNMRLQKALAVQKLQTSQKLAFEMSCRGKIFKFLRTIVQNRRRSAAAKSITRWFSAHLPLVRARKLIKGFKRLAVRKSNSAAVSFSLARLREAALRRDLDPSLRLGNRTKAALSELHVGSMTVDLLRACQVLEYSTEYSEECRLMFAQSKKADVLCGLLRSCNRSESHQELLRSVLVVLLHIARVPRFAAEIAHSADLTECLVDLLQMFRDKKSLFKLACELLTRFAMASPFVKDICKTVVVYKRLEGIYHIIERKDRLESRVRAIGARSVGAKVAAPADILASKSRDSVEPIQFMQHLMSLFN